jgi:GTPase SAR1 family protein
METYDVSLKHPLSMLVVGPSGSGKTVLVSRLLANRQLMIENVPETLGGTTVPGNHLTRRYLMNLSKETPI